MQNVEYKAELRDIEAARAQCRALKAHHIGPIRQVDTYYRVANGRLKRRCAQSEPIEWILYHRPNRIEPRVSRYTILEEDQAKARWGTRGLQPWLEVVKTRDLWTLENARIHLDEVDRLGTFIEFEAVVSDEHDIADCANLVGRLRETFLPIMGEAVSRGYSDLMAALVEG